MSEQPSASVRAADTPSRGVEADARSPQERFRGLSRRRQFTLIEELLLTRSDELLRAYPGLLAVGHGFRRRRTHARDSMGEIVRAERCVLFLVRKKWKRRGSQLRRLPAHLYCHDLIRGRRTLLAIPTDVSESLPLQANASPEAVDVADRVAHGVLTCLVDCTLVDGTRERRALSCRHVLSLSGIRSPEPDSVPVRHNGALIGDTLAIRGELSATDPAGFDAQAMRVSTPAAAHRCVFAAIWPRGHVSHAGEFESSMWLQLPRDDGAIRVNYRGVWPVMRVSYGSGAAGFVASVGPLVEVELVGNQKTLPGDSGSPLVIGYAKPRLAGMHIAGNPDDGNGRALSYCIPAYALMDPGNYAGAHGEQWTLPRN